MASLGCCGRGLGGDLPETFGPYTPCYNRFVRWRRAGVWSKIMNALAGAHDVAAVTNIRVLFLNFALAALRYLGRSGRGVE